MSWLISAALRQRVIVLAAAAVLVVYGTRVALDTPFDVFPEFAPPTVEIQTEAPGLSTDEVESLVTIPLENALNGTPWLKTLRSKSVLGLSSVVLLFEDGTDLARARQATLERLNEAARNLPAVARAPVMLQPLSSTSRALKIGISSAKLSQAELSELARWTIRPRLLSIRGVANVAIWGSRDREIQVRIDPRRLHSLGVPVASVERAATDATAVGAGGFVDTQNQRLALRHVSAAPDAESLAEQVVVHRGGVPVRLGDVAEVAVGHAVPIGDAVINDGPGILLIVEKHPWGNTLEVTRRVEASLALLREGLKDVEIDSTIFRPASYIERSISNLGWAMVFGAALVAGILAVFLADWRTAVISMTAIPLSIVAAAVVLHLTGAVANVMVLAGLVIAMGEVVDDAIIDVENVSRRLRENQGKVSPFQVVLQASLEVRSAVIFASLIVVLVFLPVYFLEGLAGSFFRPLALAYVLAISASLLVALTVTPALCLILLPRATAPRHDSALVRVLKILYRRALPPLVARPRAVLVFLGLSLSLAVLAMRGLGDELLPDFKETDFLMHWVEKPGIGLDSMRRITERVSKELRGIPGVKNFGSHIGRAEVADEVVGPNFTELWISIDPAAQYDATVAAIREVVDGYPGLYRDVLTYLKERIKEVLTGASATIVVRTFGPDLGALRSQAEAIAHVVGEVPGVVDLKVEPQVLVPQVTVRARPEAGALLGLTAGAIRSAVSTLVAGKICGQVYEGPKTIDVAVRGTEEIRRSVEALGLLPLETPSGALVPLGQVADVSIGPAPNEIKREGASRRLDVSCNVRGRDLGAVAAEVESKVRSLSFETGYRAEVVGENRAKEESKHRLLALAGLALLGTALLLHADFGTLRLTLLILLTLPFALIGGVVGAFASGGVLSLGSLVGFVTVLGIAARNAILLVSHYRHLEDVEGVPFGLDLVLRGAEERLAPILMTALCAALALLPLVVAGNVPGHEIEHPMAWVILGGLLTSTVLNILCLPSLYLAFGRRPSAGSREITVP